MIFITCKTFITSIKPSISFSAEENLEIYSLNFNGQFYLLCLLFGQFYHILIIMKQAGPTEQILTITEVADYLRITEKTVYRMLSKKSIPAFKIGGAWRFSRIDILNWIEKKKQDCND